MNFGPDCQYLYDLGLLIENLVLHSPHWEQLRRTSHYQRMIGHLDRKLQRNKPAAPPLRMELRPPKQGEMIWNGVQGKVTLMPYDSKEDHWVLVPVPIEERVQ